MIAFPQQAPALGPQAYPAASFEGTLVLENDCLRVISSYDGSTIYTPLWPPNVTLHTDVDPVEVRNPDGRVVARVGEPVALGGAGSFSAEIFDNLRAPIPKNCLEPYWYAAPFSETDVAVAPTPLPTQPVPSGLDPNDALVQDAQYFAASEGIGLEEAVRRLRLQEPIGVLGAELERNESATFAGLWIQHQPEYRLVVAFTRDGDQAIKPYVAGGPLEDFVEIRTARYTLAELQAAHNEMIGQLNAANIRVSSGTNVQENRVEVYVYDAAQFNEVLREANITLPEAVVPVASGTNPVPNLDATPTPLPPGVNVFFPQLAPQISPSLPDTSGIEGVLINDNGCLRVESSVGGESALVLWPPEVILHPTPDVIEVRKQDGSVVARVGEMVRFGGSGFEASDQAKVASYAEQLREPLPQQCVGPYWVAALNVLP